MSKKSLTSLPLMLTAVALTTQAPVWATRIENDMSVMTSSFNTIATSMTAGTGTTGIVPVDESNSLREGTITAIAPLRNQIEINGKWLTMDVGKTRLFRLGLAINGDVLVVGQFIKFTLLGGGSVRYTFKVIYVP